MASHPFILQFLEIWFEKSGSRKVVDQINRWFYTINPHFFRLEKSGPANSDFFSGSRKVFDQKNRWVYTIIPPFFRLEKIGSANSDFFSGFAEPLF